MVYDRRDSLSWTCDKLRMKEQVAARCEDILIPHTLWSGTNLKELQQLDFPDRWVLKPNHGSQRVILGTGTPKIDDLARETDSWLDPYIGIDRGEWAYTRARPLYVLEEWIGEGSDAPDDYKFFVFDGIVQIIQVDTDRFQGHKLAIFSRDWDRLEVSKSLHMDSPTIPRPAHLDLMIQMAEIIASEYDFMRVDLFDTPRGVFFGEVTPYPGSGLSPFSPPEFDNFLGSHWMLPPISSIPTEE